MALFGIIFFFVALVLVGVGIALGAFVSVLTFALVTLGVISSSVVVGVRRKSAQAGVRTFLILGGILGGIPCGMFGAWLATTFMALAGTDAKIFFYGGVSGAVCGVGIALLLDFLFRRSSRWVAGRLKPAEQQIVKVG
jgi:hypothetical protein